MVDSGKPLTAVRDRNLLAAYEYWDGKRQGRVMPSRADLDPRDIPRLLPSIILIDVQKPDNRLKVRLAGTLVVEVYGSDYTGRYLDEIYFGVQRDKVLEDYNRPVVTREPYCTDHRFHNVNDIVYDTERIILPLSDDGESVAMLLAVLSFREVRRWTNTLDSGRQT